jgi:hypothetical protein
MDVMSAEGLTITDVRVGRHIKVICEEGCITAAKTPGDWRNMRNIRTKVCEKRASCPVECADTADRSHFAVLPVGLEDMADLAINSVAKA